MGQLALYTAIIQSFFQPNKWIITDVFAQWLASYGNLQYDQSKTIAKTVSYFQKAIVGATTMEFLQGQAEQQNPASEHFQINAIQVYTGAAATLNQTDWARGVTDALTKNGGFIIKNNNSDETEEIPFTQFIPATNDASSGLFILDKPIMWVAQTPLLVTGKWPTAIATANLNMRIELVGIKLI